MLLHRVVRRPPAKLTPIAPAATRARLPPCAAVVEMRRKLIEHQSLTQGRSIVIIVVVVAAAAVVVLPLRSPLRPPLSATGASIARLTTTAPAPATTTASFIGKCAEGREASEAGNLIEWRSQLVFVLLLARSLAVSGRYLRRAT